MTGRGPGAGELGFEAFGAACGLAIVAGGLSVVLPAFDALTATLVALAVAGWASIHRRESSGRLGTAGSLRAGTLSFAVLGVASVAFLDPPGPLAPWRALVLGLGVVPLWVAERVRSTSPRRSWSRG